MAPETAPAGTVMLFDGVCNFCSGSVAFVLKRSGGDVRFCAMQTPPGQHLLKRLNLPAAEFETMVVLDGGRALVKSEAVLRLGRSMRGPWPWIATALAVVPRSWCDRLYDWIAAHRYQIWGRKTQCMVPDPEARRRFVLDIAEIDSSLA
jgi:predicted DCC family thiol-disulfide oxidoreductase YuxK